MKTVQSINPYTAAVIEEHRLHTASEICTLIEKANRRFAQWQNVSFRERAAVLMNVSEELTNNRIIYARMITDEMGKPVSQSVAEVEKCAWVCRYYAENAENFLKNTNVSTEASQSYIAYEPLGVILAIMPWNYPFWQAFRFAAPALMAGNAVVLKHASNVWGCAKLLEAIFLKGGLPPNTFTTLLADSSMVKKVIENPLVKAVTLTGSTQAGSSVASIAGKHIKKTVLELGGSNALLVFADADIEKTADACIAARFQNTGQSCIAGKRLLVHNSIARPFTDLLIKKIKNLKCGNPADTSVYIGTLARVDLAEELDRQVQESVQAGAEIQIGGKRNEAFYEPTLLTGVTPEMTVFQEETFGPVLPVTVFETDEEAIELSNRSAYGLGVSLFSNKPERLLPYIPQLQEGAVFINDFVKSDPRLPFGGIKNSGYGRELSEAGIKEFVNFKTVYIR